MIRAVIVDDEKKSRDVLKKLLKEIDIDVTIIGEGNSVTSGFEVIKHKNPQVVFLDVEMLDGTGFNLLEKFEAIDFNVIFTTAYDKYAVKAFKYSAIDYLLKPISITQLGNAVSEAKKGIDLTLNYDAQLKVLINNNKESEHKRLTIKGATKIDFVKIEDILCCEAAESYCNFIMINGATITSSKTLKHFDAILTEYEFFFRANKSHLINLNCVKSFVRAKNLIVLKNDFTVEISRRNKKQFLEKMDL